MEFTLDVSGNVRVESEKRTAVFAPHAITLTGDDISFPGEYERGGIAVRVREFVPGAFVANALVEGRHIAYIPGVFEGGIPEWLSDFMGDVDVLLLGGGRPALPLYETLEPRMCIPVGAERLDLLAALGQAALTSVEKYRTKEADFSGEQTIFVSIGV